MGFRNPSPGEWAIFGSAYMGMPAHARGRYLSRYRLACALGSRVDPTNHVLDGGSGSPKGNRQFWGWANTGMPTVSLQRDMDLEMSIFGKGSGTWESARRGLVLSYKDYLQFGFGATMRPFVKLLWPLVITSFPVAVRSRPIAMRVCACLYVCLFTCLSHGNR